MNKMKKNMIIDCSDQLSNTVSRIEECENELRQLITLMSEIDCGDDFDYMINIVRKEIEEQAVRVRRLSFVLMSAANTVNDGDKKSLQVCTGETKLTYALSKNIMGNVAQASTLKKLPSIMINI